MQVPNWKHNSGKHQKRKLKPQALRQAKARRQALKNKHPKRGVFFYKYLKSICKMDAQDFRSLQVAYMEVYQEIDEELTGERKKRALEKGGYWADRVASGKEGQPLERRDRSGNVTMRTTTKAPNKRGGKEDKGYRKADWPGYEADRGSGNKARRRAEKLNKEEVNLYDIILSHLLDEGYAETPEAAEAIMVNMSEEWRDSIVEEQKPRPVAKMDAKAKELNQKFLKSKPGSPEAKKLISRVSQITGTRDRQTV